MMHVNMVVETYDWMAAPALADLTNNAINTTSYDWVRAWVLVKDTTVANPVVRGKQE